MARRSAPSSSGAATQLAGDSTASGRRSRTAAPSASASDCSTDTRSTGRTSRSTCDTQLSDLQTSLARSLLRHAETSPQVGDAFSQGRTSHGRHGHLTLPRTALPVRPAAPGTAINCRRPGTSPSGQVWVPIEPESTVDGTQRGGRR